jgi:hypothetical protein
MNSSRSYTEGGCVLDEDLVLNEGTGLGSLVRLREFGKQVQMIDEQVQMHDCVEASLHGRRGLLVLHRYAQVRFYEPPLRPGPRWPYTELYSFYTPSRQAGLLTADVDGDARLDVLAGNYWIRAPERFDLPWRLFAINTWSEEESSATLRLAALDPAAGAMAVAQGEMPIARISIFLKPRDPTEQWKERPLTANPSPRYPHALAAGDFNHDGRVDLFVAENAGPGSRAFVVWSATTSTTLQTVWSGAGLHSAFASDLNTDGKSDIVAVGVNSILALDLR